MKDHVVFDDGAIVELRDLSKWTSFATITLSPHYVRLCEFIATTYYSYPLGSDEYKTLVNLLFLKSYKVRAVAAVIMISRIRVITSIHFDFMGPEFSAFFNYPVTFATP